MNCCEYSPGMLGEQEEEECEEVNTKRSLVHSPTRENFSSPEAVFLVVRDPSMNVL